MAGLLGIAAAPDFTEDLIESALSADQKAALMRDGVVHLAGDHAPEPTPVTKALIEDGRRHLVLGEPIPLDVPVRLVHGMKDADVPWQTSLRIARAVASEDVEITLVKDGGHRPFGGGREGAAVRDPRGPVGADRKPARGLTAGSISRRRPGWP